MPRPLGARVLASTGGDIDAVRNHILDAAHRVISEHGLAAASTRLIAAEAGVGAGTVYNYFDNRLQLLARAILRRARILAEPIADLPSRAGTDSIADNLQYFALVGATILDELVPLIAAAFSDVDLLDVLRQEMTADGQLADIIQGIEGYLLAERELGRVSPDADCYAAASTIVALSHDHAFQRYLHKGTGTADPLTREIDLIARAVTV